MTEQPRSDRQRMPATFVDKRFGQLISMAERGRRWFLVYRDPGGNNPKRITDD